MCNIFILKDYHQNATNNFNNEKYQADSSVTKASNITISKIYTFGKYYQNNNMNEKTDLTWKVIFADNDKALLLSEKCIDVQSYNKEYNRVSWETCSLRKWLNNEFYNVAFNENEKEKILLSNFENVYDRVSILSVDECKLYFDNNIQRKAYPTKFSIKYGARTGTIDGASIYWLRSNKESTRASIVGPDGGFWDYTVTNSDVSVRPIIMIGK